MPAPLIQLEPSATEGASVKGTQGKARKVFAHRAAELAGRLKTAASASNNNRAALGVLCSANQSCTPSKEGGKKGTCTSGTNVCVCRDAGDVTEMHPVNGCVPKAQSQPTTGGASLLPSKTAGTTCVQGWYSKGGAACEEMKCKAGWGAMALQAESEQDGCMECGAGAYSPGGGAQCLQCDPGYFTAAAGKTSCQPMKCPAGQARWVA